MKINRRELRNDSISKWIIIGLVRWLLYFDAFRILDATTLWTMTMMPKMATNGTKQQSLFFRPKNV